MRNNRIIRGAIFALILILIFSQGNLAFAGKPVSPQPVKSLINIINPDQAFTIPENQPFEFSLNLSMTQPLTVTWQSNPSADGLLNLGNVASSIIKNRKSTTFLQTATYLYTPVDNDLNKTVSYTIFASDGGSINKDQITVTFIITPVITEPEPTSINYVALGDSIPSGVSYEYDTTGGIIDSYTDKLNTHLTSQYDHVNYLDYSISGYNAQDLVFQLENPEIQQSIIDADMISLCIGANDIMDAAKRKTGYILGFIPFSYIDFYDIDWPLADTGRNYFEQNYPLIIDKIYDLNSDVQLIITNVFNPYNQTDSTAYNYKTENLNIHDQVGLYLWNNELGTLGINTIIENYRSFYGYKVVDIYNYFESNYGDSKGNVTGFYGLAPISGIDIKDPHPDKNGQQLIFDQHLTDLLLPN